MKRFVSMSSIVLLGIVVMSPLVAPGEASAGYGSLSDAVAKETRLTGTVGGNGSLLALDSPIYFAQGSKSERVVTNVRLNVPDDVRDKVRKLEHKHVDVAGLMECTMEYSPWTATCELTIRQIEPAR